MQSINNLARGAYQSLTTVATPSTVDKYARWPLTYFAPAGQADQTSERFVLLNAGVRRRLLDQQDIVDLRLHQSSRTAGDNIQEKASPRFWRPLSWNGLELQEVDCNSEGFTRVTDTKISPAKLARMARLMKQGSRVFVLDQTKGEVHCVKGKIVRVSGPRDPKTVVTLQSTAEQQ